MNHTIEMDANEIKSAISEYLSNRGLSVSNITLSHSGGDYNSPDQREHATFYSAKATIKAKSAGGNVVTIHGTVHNSHIQQGNR